MKKRGFSALFSIDSYKEIDFSLYERLIDTILPSEYKIIVQNFILGEGSLNQEPCWHEEKETEIPTIGYYFINDETEKSVDIFNFVSFEKTINAGVFEYGNHKMLVIGNGCGDIHSFLGISENNYGKILSASTSSWDDESELIVLANDIFEFIRGLSSVPITLNQLPFDRLYKNWGEDFWRIRPNETAPPNPPLAGGADYREERL